MLLLFPLKEGIADEIHPKLSYVVQEAYLKSLPSAFSALDKEELSTDWGKELRIGYGLAKDFDLYRAVTAFKRARLLAPENSSRKLEAEYRTLHTYYLGKRYKEIDQLFCNGTLDTVGSEFPLFHDLLVILYDTYSHLGENNKTHQLLELIRVHFPNTHEKLLLYEAFKSADLPRISEPFVTSYITYAKNPLTASLYNALLPGLGYYYLGLTQTAITALLLNGLFISACAFFFRKRAWAAFVLFLSFEIGWYVGGIQGGKTHGLSFNERTYEALANPLMNREGIFPIHLLRYGI